MQRNLPAMFLAYLIALSGHAASYDYFVTAPDMRWAYSVDSGPTACVVRLRLPDVTVVNEGGAVALEPGGPVAWPQPGEPELPVVPVVVRVQEGAAYHISINPGEPRVKAIGVLRPVGVSGSVSVNDAVTQVVERRIQNPEIYSSTNAWPDQWYTVHEAPDGDARYVRIGLMPFRYRPVTGELQQFTELELILRFTDLGAGAP